MDDLRVAAAKALTGLAVLAQLVALAWLLPSPGFGPSRLLLFLAIGVLAVAGAVGAFAERAYVVLGSGLGLFLLGSWQAVLGIVMVPVAGALVVAGVVLLDAARTASPA